MKLYADLPARRTRQVVADLFMLGWLVLWVWAGRRVDDLVMGLAGPGRSVADAGRNLEDGLTSAGDTVADLPFVPDGVRAPFETAGGAGSALQDAGQAQVEAVDRLATFLGVTIAAIPILVLLVLWLPLRVRFVREATSAQRFIDGDADLDLFALRALARQPMTALARVHDDPAGAWRGKDPGVILALATIELKACGLRPPAP